MKRKVFAMFLVSTVLASTSVYAEETTEKVVEAVTGDVAAPASATEGLSDDIYSFQLAIDGEIYQFPMSYDDFMSKGWEWDGQDAQDEMIGSNGYGMAYVKKANLSAMIFPLNLDINECPVKECLIAGISIRTPYDGLENTIELPKGITMGVSTLEDVEAAYGTPSDSYDGEYSTRCTYQKDYYESVEINIDKETGVVSDIDVRYFAEPEGFEKGEVSTDVPEIVTAYAVPTAPGEHLMDTTVEYAGDLYQLPCPISAFLANGWEMQDLEEGAYLAGREMNPVELFRDNQTVRVYDYNLTENATAYENGFVCELKYGTYDSEELSLVLGGGFKLGSTREEIMAEADAQGYFVKDDEDYLTISIDEDSKYDNNVELWFNPREDADKVASITYNKRKLD